MVPDLIKCARYTSGYIKPEMTYDNMDKIDNACPKLFKHMLLLRITGSSIGWQLCLNLSSSIARNAVVEIVIYEVES